MSSRISLSYFDGRTIAPSLCPDYAIGKTDPLDQFYTKPDVAKYCLGIFHDTADHYNYDLTNALYLEPSAGQGAFVDLLDSERVIALDIDPKHSSVIKADFLNYTPQAGTYICIGNPPFGHRGIMALAFINRAAVFSDLVGFILPMTFNSNGKGTAYSRVQGLTLLRTVKLPEESFEYADGKSYAANTVFQVWGKTRHNKRIRPKTCDRYITIKTVSDYPSRECGMQWLSEYDYFITCTFYENYPPRIVTNIDDAKFGNYIFVYGIYINQERDKISKVLESTDWTKYSSESTGNRRHIRMHHIKAAIMDAGFKD